MNEPKTALEYADLICVGRAVLNVTDIQLLFRQAMLQAYLMACNDLLNAGYKLNDNHEWPITREVTRMMQSKKIEDF